MVKYKTLVLSLLVPAFALAAPLGDYTFKSPAFNGQGYSSHTLTVYNLEQTAQKAQADKIQAALDKAASEKANSNLSKFLNNLESRVYAQISQNLAASMFAGNNDTCRADSTKCGGTINFQGSTIQWSRVQDVVNCTGSATSTCIMLNVTDPSGSQTQIYVPLVSFTMPGS